MVPLPQQQFPNCQPLTFAAGEVIGVAVHQAVQFQPDRHGLRPGHVLFGAVQQFLPHRIRHKEGSGHSAAACTAVPPFSVLTFPR